MFWSSWDSIQRILLVGITSYLGLIFLLRLSGNRTLSQMNSFDFIVTIAMGSTFSSGLLQKSVPLSDTMTALAFLVSAQYILSFLKTRSTKVKSLLTNEPVLLYYGGSYMESAMKEARITPEEIRASAREQGLSTLSQIEAVVLEANGKLSVVAKQLGSTSSAPAGEQTFSH